MADPWAAVLDFPEDAGKFATTEIDPRVHALEESAPKLMQMRAMFDEKSQEHAPETEPEVDSSALKGAAPALMRQRERTETQQQEFDLQRAMGTAPTYGSGASLEELGLHEPTPDKSRWERVKEGVGKVREKLREGVKEDLEYPAWARTPRRIGEVGGKIVQGMVGEGKQALKAIEEAEKGDPDPQNITKLASNLFGGGATKAMGAAETFGVSELGAFSKSGEHLTFGPRLKGHTDIKTNFPDADFWIVRKGDATAIGKPTREFSPEHIGIRSRNHNILPDYLYYAFEAAHSQGHFRQYATGATKLENLRVRDIENLSLGQIMRGRGMQHEVGAFGSAPSRPNRWTPEMVDKLSELSNKHGRNLDKIVEEFRTAFPDYKGSKLTINGMRTRVRSWGGTSEQTGAKTTKIGKAEEGTDLGVFGGKRNKITVLVDALRGREEFEALSDELYRFLVTERNNIMPAAHRLADELAVQDPRLFDSITRLTQGTSHEVIGELAEQIAARQLYERMLGTPDFDLGAFGGRGPGGRIEIEDVREIAKRLKVGFKDEGRGRKGTEYARLRRYDKGGVLDARVRIPSKDSRKGRDAGRRRYPHEILFDTSDAPIGKRWGEADPVSVANASGGRYSDIRNLEAALRFLFAKGSKDNPNFLVSPQDRPFIWREKPPEVEPIGIPPEQAAFDWDSVVEFQ
jgi:hypothetical protein